MDTPEVKAVFINARLRVGIVIWADAGESGMKKHGFTWTFERTPPAKDTSDQMQ